MIEVVIASAVAIVLLAAVHSTVTAMTRSAKNIRTNSEQRAGMQRFLEILRRDLQGWFVTENEATPNAAGSSIDDKSTKAMLSFTTTSDGLTHTTSERPRSTSVSYSLRTSPDGTEVLRTEGNNRQTDGVVIWKDRRALMIEFLKDKKWVGEWSSKERPACVRVRSGADEVYLGTRM